MTRMTVYSMADIYKKADEYAMNIDGGMVDYIEIGVTEERVLMVMVHWSDKKKGQNYLGSFHLICELNEEKTK